ncbi:flagellar attachment zone protein, partial [Trypanosoma conorhini]
MELLSVLPDDRHAPPVGAVVAYERLEHDSGATWGWALGTIQSQGDDYRCVVRRWDREAWGGNQHAINAVMHELRRVNDRMRASQHRLFDAERRISRRGSELNGSASYNNSISSNDCNQHVAYPWVQGGGGGAISGEIASCIHEMSHCRNKSKSLSDELTRLKNSPSVPPSVMCFTRRRGEEETILTSSLIRAVTVDVDAPTCVITGEEAAAIKAEAGAIRLQQQQQLGSFRDRLGSMTAELSCLQAYNEELEARMKLYLDALLEAAKARAPETEAPRMPAEGSLAEVTQLRDEVRELAGWDWQRPQAQQLNTRWVATRHTLSFPWGGADVLVADKPEELLATFTTEVVNALRAPPDCVSHATFQAAPAGGLTAAFDVRHPTSVPSGAVEAQLRAYKFPYLENLHRGAGGPKQGLDRAIEDVCRVLGISEKKYNGLRFSDFLEELAELNMSADKDAYESEVGDLLIMLDKLYGENRSLQHALAHSNAEVRELTAEAQRERDYLQLRTADLHQEVARLNGVIAKLRELADRLEGELHQYQMQNTHVQHVRTTRQLPDEATHDKDLYCVTFQEYTDEKERAARLCDALEEEKQNSQATLRELQAHNQQLETLLGAKMEQINQLEPEVRAFRKKRHDSIHARLQDGMLSTLHPGDVTADPTAKAVQPHVIDTEPLFSVTLEELNELRNTNEKLAEEMLDKAVIIQKLAEELTEKEAENEKLAGELLEKAEVVEKMAENFIQKEADNEKLAEEILEKAEVVEKLAEDLAEKEAENEKLAEDLAVKDVHLEGLQTDVGKSLESVRSRCRELEELAAAREVAAAEEVDVLEGELAEALVQFKALEGENAALLALLAAKNAELRDANAAALTKLSELESRLASAEEEAREERDKADKLMATTQGALRAMG